MATACAHDAANETGQCVEPSYEVTLNASRAQPKEGATNGFEYFLLSVMAASWGLMVASVKPVLGYHAAFLAKSPVKSVR